jgi:hypothetical protein
LIDFVMTGLVPAMTRVNTVTLRCEPRWRRASKGDVSQSSFEARDETSLAPQDDDVASL